MTKRSTYERLYLSLCSSIDSPYSLKMWLLFKYDQDQLVQQSISPSNYLDPNSFFQDYQVLSFVKKYKGLAVSVDKKRVALDGFHQREKVNFVVNRFLDRPATPANAGFWARIFDAQKKIADLLGPFSLFKVDDLGWGPGSTSSLKGRNATLVHKLREERLTITGNLLPLAQNILGQDLHWAQARGIIAEGPCSWLKSEFQVVRGSRLLTVPKDATKDRVIAAEPTVNLFFQKGVGNYFRTRLMKVGIDLNDQTINQSLAGQAFKKHLCTIDLKNASNSVCTSLVENLLPPEWFEYLSSLRTEYVVSEGKHHKLELFSSMGNGFTFELESLIFWALCKSVVGQNGVLGVYGDDLIFHRRYAQEIIWLLSYAGFETNESKSYVDGNFYESCGKHYFMGVDVTPIYQKHTIIDNIDDLESLANVYKCANALRRCVHRIETQCLQFVLDIRPLIRAWFKIKSVIGVPRHVVPLSSLSDDGLALPSWQLQPYIVRRVHGFGFQLKVLESRGPVWRKGLPHQALLAYVLRFPGGQTPLSKGLGTRGTVDYVNTTRFFSWDLFCDVRT